MVSQTQTVVQCFILHEEEGINFSYRQVVKDCIVS